MAWFIDLSKLTIINASQRHKITDPFLLLPSFTFLSHFSSNTIVDKPFTKHTESHSGLEQTEPNEKLRVVVLGSGWAGCRLMKGLDPQIYDIVCFSPRNHMVVTPLLASTCVGTLEFRYVVEPIGRIQPAISREPGSSFFLANCTGIDAHKHMVHCETVTDELQTIDSWRFTVSYDKLVIALGSHTVLHFWNSRSQRYTHVKDYIRVTLIEANEILSSFDDRLRRYATQQLTKVRT